MKFVRGLILALAASAYALASGFAGLCNTGVTGPCPMSGGGASLAADGLEASWVLQGGITYVMSNAPSAWAPNGPSSRWIGAAPDAMIFMAPGNYSYTLTFMIGALADLSTAIINGRYMSDNNLLSVSLNGAPLSGVPLNNNDYGAFQQWTNFTLPNTAGFVLGSNALTFTVSNPGPYTSPTGLRVEFFNSSIADLNANPQAPEPGTMLLGGIGLAAVIVSRRFKQQRQA